MNNHPFTQFLADFIPQVALKSMQCNKAIWLLETTGSEDACDLKASLDTELRMLFHDKKTYEQLLLWDKDPLIVDPLLKRQLNVLIRTFKQNQIDKTLLEELATKEAHIAQSYAGFRPKLDGKPCSENDLREILKTEVNPDRRKKAWEASKEIGTLLAPQILELVELRNKAATSLGFSNYFEMQLELQEVDDKWLTETFNKLADRSDSAHGKIIDEIEQAQAARFKVKKEDLGPWAWAEPFCQEDPLDSEELDGLVEGVDISAASRSFFKQMGFDVGPILAKSDMEERSGKNQHAFCINIDRNSDVRTLNNIKPTLKWLETVLHELGHAVYELGFDKTLPWLLREPPHMIPTEAMALMTGRQAYKTAPLQELVGLVNRPLFERAEKSLIRRQLVFSRWVLVMTAFERELYKNPHQELNALWWKLVQQYQKVLPPKERSRKDDWASKYHIGLAPVYYFSYLLGELFASSIQEKLKQSCGTGELIGAHAGEFLQKRLFFPGNAMSWSALVSHVTGHPLSPEPWLNEFALS